MSHRSSRLRRVLAAVTLTAAAVALAGCGSAASPATGAAPNADRAAAAEGVSPDVNLG
ncbi:hypothetical protein AB0E69_05350 [Kribbella sp. NPDC026611]|uniref:hypothetical protein n=1 Tax=Kribbella sp. NPDC026611 TaxID=3154911 RepID=UPI0033CAFD61